MTGEEAERWGFFNKLAAPETLLEQARLLARSLADGPTVAHGITKAMLHREWNMSIDDAIDAEAEAQARCMTTQDFKRAYEAFAAKREPTFEGN
jgi:enoyl-CoA hydratase/carnithine racemase